jgi:hypothetical protein
MLEMDSEVAGQPERSAAEEREREQDAEFRALQLAVAEDHRVRDQMRAERRDVRATLGLATSFGGASER